jgi:hypothetical protein
MMTLVMLCGCTRPLASLDDEAGVTTNMGEESTGEESTDEESTSTETSSSSESTIFITHHDVSPDPQNCDPFAQDCPPGEKCVPYSTSGDVWDANKCVPVMGDQHQGEPCTWAGVVEATDNCDATSICWDVMDVDGELLGTCTTFCMGTADAPECPEGSSCIVNSDSSINLCIFDCDPLLQDCGAGLGCYFAVTAFNCIFTTDDIPVGEPCGYINDCAPGNYCTDASVVPDCGGPACCTNFCDLDLGDAQCTQPGTVCTTFFEPGTAPPGYEDVGLCILPP